MIVLATCLHNVIDPKQYTLQQQQNYFNVPLLKQCTTFVLIMDDNPTAFRKLVRVTVPCK